MSAFGLTLPPISADSGHHLLLSHLQLSSRKSWAAPHATFIPSQIKEGLADGPVQEALFDILEVVQKRQASSEHGYS